MDPKNYKKKVNLNNNWFKKDSPFKYKMYV